MKTEKTGSNAKRAETSDSEAAQVMKTYEQQSPYYQGQTGQAETRVGKEGTSPVISKFPLNEERKVSK